MDSPERDLQIGGIYFQLLAANRAWDGTIEAEKPYDDLIRRLEELELTQPEIGQIANGAITDPSERVLDKALHIEAPMKQGESRRSHLRRALGETGEEIADALGLPWET